jgi:hypothetical protein
LCTELSQCTRETWRRQVTVPQVGDEGQSFAAHWTSGTKVHYGLEASLNLPDAQAFAKLLLA